MGVVPDEGIAEMANLLVRGNTADRRGDRPPRLGRRPGHRCRRRRDQDGAPPAARSTTARRARLLEVEDTRERISRRELYRHCERISEIVIDVAERIVYAVVKES